MWTAREQQNLCVLGAILLSVVQRVGITSGHMIKALMLVFMPVRTWDEIVQAQRGVLKILTIYLLPLLLVTSLIEGYGLVHWGEPQTIIKRQTDFRTRPESGSVAV